MKNNIVAFCYFTLIVIFGVMMSPGQVFGAVCMPGYIQGNVPATQVPDYSYTADGFLELHFRITDASWKYNYDRVLLYGNDCNLLPGIYGEWGDKKSFTWPGITHLLIRFSDGSPDFPNYYHANIYNGDTGELLVLNDNSMLSWLHNSYTSYSYGPVIRFIFGNRAGINGDINWNTEDGDLVSSPALPVKIVPVKNPVLIVPGLIGSYINKGSDKLWLDLGHNFTDIGDGFMDPLQFSQNLAPIDASLTVGDVIGKETVDIGVGKLTIFDYTDGIINEFKNQGYVENQNLFTFPYDWRYGVTGKYANGKTNANLLAEKIQSILAQTGASKVDVVAHSMGGLITKQYVADNSVNNYISKAVFVGVPNTGAPKSVKALLQGDNFGVLGLSDQEMKKIAANMPSAYDLLPSQKYYDTKGSYIKTIDQTKCFEDYTIPCEVKDLNYQESGTFLSGQGLNSLAITNATNLHTQSYDDFDLRTAGVDLYAIDGCKSATLSKVIQIKYSALFGQQFSYDLRFAPGDGTVPLESATNLPINQNNKFYSLSGSHSKMLSANGSRQEIVNLISGSNLSIPNNLITQDLNQCQLNGRAISVFSPVDIFVTDQNGNKLGLAEDGSIINEIPGADFEILDSHKFLFLPQDGGQTYSVNMQGTGDGTYTIKSQNIDNSQVVKAEIFNDLPVTSALAGNINIDLEQTTLSVKQNPTDLPTTILPTKVLDFSADKISPEAVLYFDSSAKDLKFYGTDNLSEMSAIAVADKVGVTVLTDEAGNNIELGFKERNRRTAMSAQITSIKYNGAVVALPSNSFSYSWAVDSAGKLTKLLQKVSSRKNYTITATYDGINTKITGTTSAGKFSQSFVGLKVIKVTTNKGDLNWSY